ncbi:hypothetical protein FSP39_007998 [Pinctada imbricata]|uniref:ISXO2-like transposase domain-containing protein n=1 Tax=Pinctada imbricata TaxID=66713 RepID=A0AA88XZR3_PINIB|nr:hypothetical protein FSP39_007998 [Pinctada imbricata]
MGSFRKYSRGSVRNEGGPWIFRMIDRKGRFVVWSVQDRTKATLQPLIVFNTVPGPTIYSDEWALCANLTSIGYTHRKVKHPENFVAVDGTHINTIEGFLGNAKQYFKLMRGTN